MDYAELVKDIRYCVSGDTPCGECKHIEELSCHITLMEKAADAIENLIKRLDGSIPKGDAEIIIAELAKPTQASKCPHYIRNVHDRGDDSLCDKYKCEVNALPKWIPVTERLPKIHEEVLVCNENYGLSCLGFSLVAVWDGTSWIETWQREKELHCITHWMPLPDPPKEEA